MTYFLDLINASSCVGNTLSTLNLGLSSLDNNLWNLSAYTVEEDQDLSSQLYYLSAHVISNSAVLYNNLFSSITSVSASSPTYTRNTLYQTPDGIVNYDFGINNSNAVVTISTNGYVNNISNIGDGEYGKLLVRISPLTSVSITGWGNQWIFSQGLSTMNINLSAQNLINYYYDNSKILAQLVTF